MLAVLPFLQELRALQLSPGLLPAPHAPLEQYSALTASSHLTLLSLYHCQLPAGVNVIHLCFLFDVFTALSTPMMLTRITC
jgi:hypothetical protein